MDVEEAHAVLYGHSSTIEINGEKVPVRSHGSIRYFKHKDFLCRQGHVPAGLWNTMAPQETIVVKAGSWWEVYKLN